MIERGHDLPLTRQAELLGLSRGSLLDHTCSFFFFPGDNRRIERTAP